MNMSPTAEKQNKLATPQTAAKARQWVNKLPMSNFGEVTRRIYYCMKELNKSQISPTARIDVTEVLRPYVEISLDNLNKHLVARSFPLPERSRKIFELNQSLLLELAGSYQLAGLDMLTKGNANKRTLLLSIGRALNYMGQILLNTYAVYIRPKEALWRDIHHLYLLACENKIQNLSIPDNTANDSTCITIEDYYKHTSLLALSRPNTLRLGEIARLDSFFRSILDTVSIHSDATQVDSEHVHIAMLNSDEPAALMPVAELLSSPTVRIFDISRIILILNKYIEDSKNTNLGVDNSYPTLNRSLAKRLITSLTVVRHRRFKRFPRDDKAPLVSHLNNIVEIVRLEQLSEGGEDTTVDEDLLYEELIYGDGTNTSSSPWAAADIDSMMEETSVQLRTWHIENSCSEGYGICWREKEPASVRVGELIALRDPSDETKHWQIGTLKWMEFYPGKGLCAGLEMLSPHSQAVKVKEITNREITQKLPADGLLLPTIEGIRDKAALILPDYMFKLGDKLVVDMASRKEYIELTSINEGLGAFAWCHYIPATDEEDTDDYNDDYSDVWNSL